MIAGLLGADAVALARLAAQASALPPLQGRDLFDLWIGLGTGGADPRRIVEAFREYLKAESASVTREDCERNLAEKVTSRAFGEDLRPLLAPTAKHDVEADAQVVSDRLLTLL